MLAVTKCLGGYCIFKTHKVSNTQWFFEKYAQRIAKTPQSLPLLIDPFFYRRYDMQADYWPLRQDKLLERVDENHTEIRAYTKTLEEHFGVDVPWHHGKQRWSYTIGPFCIQHVYCYEQIDYYLYDMLMQQPACLRIEPVKTWIDHEGDAYFTMDVSLMA